MLTQENVQLVLDLITQRFIFKLKVTLGTQHFIAGLSWPEIGMMLDEKPLLIINNGYPLKFQYFSLEEYAVIAFDEFGCAKFLRLLVHKYQMEEESVKEFERLFIDASHFLIFPLNHFENTKLSDCLKEYKKNLSHLKLKVDRLRPVLEN